MERTNVQEPPKQHLRLLATSHGMNHVYQLLTPVVLPALTLEFGVFNAGLFLWSFVLSYSLLPAVTGYLSRYVGRRNLMVAGFATTSLSFLAVGLTNNVAFLAVLFFAAGVGGSTYHPLGSPILAETYPDSRGKTLGLHQTGGALGSFVGPFITGLLVFVFGWRPTLMLFAVPGLVIAAALWFSLSPKQHTEVVQQEKSRIGFSDLKTYAPAFVFMAAAFIYVFGLRGADVFANQYFTLGRGIEIAEASFLFSMLKVAGLFSAPICGRLSDTLGRKTVLIILVVVESLSLFAITISPTIILAVPCAVFGFASFGLLGVGEALLADVTPERTRPVFFGINQTLSFSPQIFLVPLLLGLSGSFGYNSGFVLLSVLMPLSIPLLLIVKTKHSRRKTG
jgi:MFS family permease